MLFRVKTDKPPRRNFPNIGPIWSGGRWKWRARVQVGHLRKVGSLHDTQQAAYEDSCQLRRTTPAMYDDGGPTFAEALEGTADDARARGVKELSVQGMYAEPGRAILALNAIPPERQLRDVSVDDVCALARSALAAGRAPITVKRSYLRVVHRAFTLAELPSPVKRARERLAGPLTVTPARSKWFSPEEFGRLAERIRAHSHREAAFCYDAVMVMGFTGIRSGEFCRVRKLDVDQENAHLHIRTAKDRRRPRAQPVPPAAMPSLIRLVAKLERGETIIQPRMLNRMFTRWQRFLEEPRLCGRALRHTYASGLLQLGATFAEVRDLMGHHPHSQVTSRYVHSGEGHRREAVNRLAGAYEDRGESQ